MTQKQEEVNVLAVLAETPLAGFIDSLKTGLYLPPPEVPVAMHETVVGELNDFEKSLWSATSGLQEKARNIADTNNEMVDEAKRHGVKVDELKVFISEAEFEATTLLLTGLSELLWYTVKKRLGAEVMNVGGLGIRAGYQLVTFPPNNDHEMEMFAEMLMGGGGRRGNMVMRAMLGGLGR